MKNSILILLASFLVYSMVSCSGCGQDSEEGAADSALAPLSSFDLPYAEVNLYKKTMRRDTTVDTARLDIDSLIKGLNWRYEKTGLQKVKIGGDTVYVTLQNSKYLSEEMGTSGAEEYIADVVANLTCLAGIHYVNFMFPEGEHASPGVYGRDVLDDLKETK
jgi:hypothetical protein